MRALVLVKNGDSRRAFEWRDLPDPICGDDEILVDTEYSGINFADVLARLGIYPDAPQLPFVPGYEVVGRIRALGSEAVRSNPALKVGSRVLALTRFGGYSSVALAKARAAIPLDDDVDGAEATAWATQGVTAWLAAQDCVSLLAGEKVLIHAAAGGVGLLLVQLAKRRGCEVFATAGSSEKLQLLRGEFQVDHAISYRDTDFVKEIRRITGSSSPIHVAFDSIGGSVFHRSRKLLAPGGRLVSFGVAEMAVQSPFRSVINAWSAFRFGFVHPLTLLQESQSVIGLNVLRIADHQPDRLARALRGVHDLMKSGEVRAQVGATFPIREVGEAHEFLASRQSIGKVVLRW